MKPSSKIRTMRTEQVAAYRSSGLSAEQFCTESQMNIHTLKYWISKLNRETRDDQEPANSGYPCHPIGTSWFTRERGHRFRPDPPRL